MPINRGFGPGSSYRFSNYKHGNLDGRNSNFRYPSQWWDASHMDLPSTIKQLFLWCRYHALVNPLVAAVVKKMAAYPITKILIDDRSSEGFDKNRKRWESFFYETLDINRFQIEVGLDFHTYGNCVISLSFPFNKYLECKACGTKHRIKRLKFKKDYTFKNFDYHLTCPECSAVGVAKVEDVFYKSSKDIKLIRWNPSDIDIDFNPITRNAEYAYRIPNLVKKKVLQGRVSYLEETPAQFIEAMKKNRPVILSSENVFHFKSATPSLASNDEGWGYPIILPALKDSFHLQVMKKAQEAVMLEHLIPLDIIYPASQDPNASPYTTVNLSDWKRKIETELVNWRMDPNHKPILPLPVGYQRIGGNGRGLMLTQEIKAHSEHIIVGMGVPQEFVFGGLSWTGSSVSLRMLENMFQTYRDMHTHFIKNFLIPKVSRFMGWQDVSVSMKAFKMADDVQNKQLLSSLNSMRKISDQTLLAEFDKDAYAEMKLIEKELRRTLEITKMDTLYKAQIQGESQQIMLKAQADAQAAAQKDQLRNQKDLMKEKQKIQKEMKAEGIEMPQQPQQGQPPSGKPGQQGGQQVNIISMAEAWAKKLQNMDPGRKAQVLQQMQSQSPELHRLVMEKQQQLTAMNQKPLPEKRPPRRQDGVI